MILFQAQIQEHQKLADHYRELAAKREALVAGLLTVQQQADSDLTSLKMLVDKCKQVSPSAIVSLKSAILQLFPSDGDDGNDGGNQPTDPTPNPDDDESELLCLNGETGDFLLSSDVDDTEAFDPPRDCPVSSDEHVIVSGSELTGQSCAINVDLYWAMTTTPDGSAWDFASPLACLLEDAPLLGQRCQLSSYWEHDWELEPLDGQAWEIATPLCCLLSDAPQPNDDKGTNEAEKTAYIELVTHPENKAIAYQRKHDGEILCLYVGFRTKAIAQSWMHFLEAITDRVELRQTKRMQGFKWEMKVKGMSMQQIERLAKEAIDKTYRPEIGSTKPPSYTPRRIPQSVNPEEVGEGDIVTALLTPSASYKVLQVMPNGILDCTNLTTGDRLGLRPGAVTLVQKAETEAVTDEPIVDPLTNILEVGDIVEVLEPPLKGEVGTVTQFNRYNELPLMVRCPGGEFSFKRHELKFITRPERKEREVTVPSIFAASSYSKSFCGC
jgi:hypothetical protein